MSAQPSLTDRKEKANIMTRYNALDYRGEHDPTLRIYEHHEPTSREVAAKIVDHMLENGKRGIRTRGWYALPYSVREGIMWLLLFLAAGSLAVWVVRWAAPWIDGVAR